jgi:uncharacterized protein YyaL (SSP411 family)
MPLLRNVKEQLGSSYLLEHADNPVEWRTWGEDAFEAARERDCPIFLSIGYAACHWCHVMAHESFSDNGVARLLNEHFVAVKVDREERPDVDALYMAATQLVTGHGGWPMSVFLLPDGRPFMAGTYYPPTDRGGQVGFGRLLRAINEAWIDRRTLVESQAEELERALGREVRFVDHLAPLDAALDLATVRRRLRDDLVAQLDVDGGFGSAPKFPRPSYVEALLEFHDEEACDAVERTLDAMARGGLFDHLGGGFARYSVDAEWHVPHFEKMLSDQALLARCYLRASRVRDNPQWREVALSTLDFLERDLRLVNGYAASLDADAGGVEGAHVTWTFAQVDEALAAAGEDDRRERVLRRWRLESPGAFEGASIPRLGAGEPFETPSELRRAYEALRAQRATRPAPRRDEKVVLEWNAMVASALLETDEPARVSRGLELLASLASTHHEAGLWWRTQHRRAHATAADVAWLADALVDAFEATGDDEWLARADEICDYLLAHYWDGALPTLADPHVGGGVFTQSDLAEDLTTRPKEIFDGATPAAHAVATRALARVGLCRGDPARLVAAQRLVEIAASLLASHPIAAPDLVAAAGFALEGVEVVVPGEPGALARHVRSRAMPRTVLISGTGTSPLLVGRRDGAAYVCRAGVCRLPVVNASDLDHEWDQALG